MADVRRYPGQCDEAYPEVYLRAPPFPQNLKPGQLSEQQFEQFFREVNLLIGQNTYRFICSYVSLKFTTKHVNTSNLLLL